MRPSERAARAAAYERARPEILAHVPGSARRVLDLGCATGATGAELKRRGEVEVVGIEIEPEYAREAERVLDRVIVADAQHPPEDLEGAFDVLIAADILEHLVDPWTALREYAALLEPGGTAVVSSPERRALEHVRGARPRQLAAQGGRDLRRLSPAVVHAARRTRAAVAGGSDDAHRRSAALAALEGLALRPARAAAHPLHVSVRDGRNARYAVKRFAVSQ